jgi:hypothetical protein
MTRRRTTALLRPFVEVLEGRWVPTTLTPTTFLDGGLGSGSLRDAVLQFNADTGSDDDIIQLEAGTYTLTIPNVGGRHETAGLTGDLNLTQTSHRWIIQGAGPSTVIDASQLQDRVFQIVNPGTQVLFQDLVIQGGLAQDNGADGAQAGTTDALGGGVLNNGGEITLENVVVQNNVARGGGEADGGGFYSTGGALTISRTTIANNQAFGGPGAPYSGFRPGGPGGLAGGGGLYASGGSLDISDSRIASNRATGGHGGDGGDYTTYFTWQVPGGPGGDAQGSGLYVNGGSLTIASSTIDSNQGIGGEGGSDGHYAGSGLAQGGGLYILSNAGMPTVTGSTFSGNSADSGGGGIYNAGTLTVSNSTLSGNSAYFGGGIYTYTTHPVTLTNVTLSANRTNTDGGGLYVDSFGGSPVLHNTLIAGNLQVDNARDDVYGRLDPGGDYNLIGDGTYMAGLSNGVNGNQVGSVSAPIDPLLGPLQDNGGPTLTHALLPGSPAIDAGNNAYATEWDQRGPGYPRIVNGILDIGAFEVQAPAASYPTRQPLPDPVPVQALGMVGSPLLGQPPDLLAAPSPLPGPGIPDGQARQSEPVAVQTAAGQQVPAALFSTYPGTGQPLASLGSLSANDLDALALDMLGGP